MTELKVKINELRERVRFLESEEYGKEIFDLGIKQGRRELAEEIIEILDECNYSEDDDRYSYYEPDEFMEKVQEKLKRDLKGD